MVLGQNNICMTSFEVQINESIVTHFAKSHQKQNGGPVKQTNNIL